MESFMTKVIIFLFGIAFGLYLSQSSFFVDAQITNQTIRITECFQSENHFLEVQKQNPLFYDIAIQIENTKINCFYTIEYELPENKKNSFLAYDVYVDGLYSHTYIKQSELLGEF